MSLIRFLSVAWVCKKKDGLKPYPNDSRWVALSVGPDVVNDSRTDALSQYMFFISVEWVCKKRRAET